MRLATYDDGTGPRTGIVDGYLVHEAAPLLREEPLRDVLALLSLPYDAVDRLRQAGVGKSGVALEQVRLLPPILRPPTIRDHIAFEEHASRTGTRELPEIWRRRPLYYYSGTARLFGAGDVVPMPATERLDYELEIAAVIGREVTDLGAEEALDAIVGFTVFNDWSARDIQYDEMAYGLGPSKGKDFGSSLGPWIVTTDELAPYLLDGRLSSRCQVRVNGAMWADSSSAEMFHSFASMVEHASIDGRLLPGDILASGTVGGCSVGEALRKGVEGARYLTPGDRVELHVEGLGVLANVVGKPSGRSLPAGYLPPAPPMPTRVG